MQVYLDNAHSTAPHSIAAAKAIEHGKQAGINENLAREMLELHSLGVDSGYTQKDIQELARIITGAGIYSPRMNNIALERANAKHIGLFLFDPRRHDFGHKTLLEKDFPANRGLEEIDDALHLLAIHPATAHRIAFKLAQRFLSDSPPSQIVHAMTKGFEQSGGKISATLLPLLESPAFSKSLQSPTKFKEPVDYVISAARAACGDTQITNRFILTATALDMGEAPFMHTTPDGYGSGEADWLSPAAMAKRVRMAMSIAAEKLPLAQADSEQMTQNSAETRKINVMRSTACTVDPISLEKMIGKISSTTLHAAKDLSPKQYSALLLASPEFMRR